MGLLCSCHWLKSPGVLGHLSGSLVSRVSSLGRGVPWDQREGPRVFFSLKIWYRNILLKDYKQASPAVTHLLRTWEDWLGCLPKSVELEVEMAVLKDCLLGVRYCAPAHQSSPDS